MPYARARTWDEASTHCGFLGGHLASPATSAEMREVTRFCQDNVGVRGACWIGLRRAGSSWRWEDGRPYNHSSAPWAEGQPSNGGDCVELHPLWTDGTDASLYVEGCDDWTGRYVCSVPVTTVSSNAAIASTDVIPHNFHPSGKFHTFCGAILDGSAVCRRTLSYWTSVQRKGVGWELGCSEQGLAASREPGKPGGLGWTSRRPREASKQLQLL